MHNHSMRGACKFFCRTQSLTPDVGKAGNKHPHHSKIDLVCFLPTRRQSGLKWSRCFGVDQKPNEGNTSKKMPVFKHRVQPHHYYQRSNANNNTCNTCLWLLFFTEPYGIFAACLTCGKRVVTSPQPSLARVQLSSERGTAALWQQRPLRLGCDGRRLCRNQTRSMFFTGWIRETVQLASILPGRCIVYFFG